MLYINFSVKLPKAKESVFKGMDLLRNMLGIFDQFYLMTRRDRADSKYTLKGMPHIQKVKDARATVIAFLPSILLTGRTLGRKLSEGAQHAGANLVTYEMPRTLVRSDPWQTREILDNIYEDAKTRGNELRESGQPIIVFGASIGCCPASRLSAELCVPQTLYGVPGSKLAECIFESKATQREVLAAQGNRRYLRHFQEALEVYNPLHYVGKHTGNVEVHLGTHDKMIPTFRGRELTSAFEEESRKRQDLEVRVEEYTWCDHSSTMMGFAGQFSKIIGRAVSGVSK